MTQNEYSHIIQRLRGLAKRSELPPEVAMICTDGAQAIERLQGVQEPSERREDLLGLLSALPGLVVDFDGHIPGEHALRLAERAGLSRNEAAWTAVYRRQGLVWRRLDSKAKPHKPTESTAVSWKCPNCRTLNDPMLNHKSCHHCDALRPTQET